MSAAILAAAQKKSFGGMAAQITLTRQINEKLGTSLAPWELETMPADWLDGLEMMIYDLPVMQEKWNQVEASLARLREKNKQVH